MISDELVDFFECCKLSALLPNACTHCMECIHIADNAGEQVMIVLLIRNIPAPIDTDSRPLRIRVERNAALYGSHVVFLAYGSAIRQRSRKVHFLPAAAVFGAAGSKAISNIPPFSNIITYLDTIHSSHLQHDFKNMDTQIDTQRRYRINRIVHQHDGMRPDACH